MKSIGNRVLLFSICLAASAQAQTRGAPPAPFQQPSGTLDQYLAAGAQSNAYLQWDDAIEFYSKALQLDPRLTRALLGRGLAYLGKGEKESAIKDFHTLINLEPRSVDAYNAHLIQQQILQEKGDLEGAVAEINQALEIRPNEGGVYHTRARVKEAKGDLDGALADYDKAIFLLPRAPAFYVNRGMARRAKGDLAGALADLSKALELNPRQAPYMVHRGDTKKAMGDLDGALADYNQALDWDLGCVQGHLQRGLLRLQKSEDAEAQADFDFALKLDPSIEPAMRKAIDDIKAKRSPSGPHTADPANKANQKPAGKAPK